MTTPIQAKERLIAVDHEASAKALFSSLAALSKQARELAETYGKSPAGPHDPRVLRKVRLATLISQELMDVRGKVAELVAADSGIGQG